MIIAQAHKDKHLIELDQLEIGGWDNIVFSRRTLEQFALKLKERVDYHQASSRLRYAILAKVYEDDSLIDMCDSMIWDQRARCALNVLFFLINRTIDPRLVECVKLVTTQFEANGNLYDLLHPDLFKAEDQRLNTYIKGFIDYFETVEKEGEIPTPYELADHVEKYMQAQKVHEIKNLILNRDVSRNT